MIKYLIVIVLLNLYGCVSTADKYIESANLDNNNSSQVTIYRTNVAYHSLNPEAPFFYIDDKFVGKIHTGGSVNFKILSGEHTLSSKESVLFMPGRESGKLKGVFETGKHYYFRYSKELANVVPTGSGFIMSDSTTLQPATEEGYKERK